jgi:hypothetical protein
MSNPDAVNWIYAIDDATLLEGHMAPAYPNGVNIGMFMSHVRTESMRTYRTRLEAGWVEVG